jgi:hypothetical protein
MTSGAGRIAASCAVNVRVTPSMTMVSDRAAVI